MRILQLIAIAFCLVTNLLPAKDYIVLHCREKTGLFSAFDDVLGLLKHYDKGEYGGIEINFFKEGLYYSSERGENWWNYYCEPIAVGERENVRDCLGEIPGGLRWEIERHTTRQEAFQLISKYIHFKPEITSFVEKFQKEHFSNHYIISVHYRGTDKFSEANFVPYADIATRITEVAKKLSKPYKIFIATDEEPFIHYMKRVFGNKVCFLPNAARSSNGDPLHFDAPDPYQCGFEAIVDALLLSKGNFLIRTSSNLSRWSTFFNPNIPVVELGHLRFFDE